MKIARFVLLAGVLIMIAGCGWSNPFKSAARATAGTVKGILTTSQRGEHLMRAKEGDVQSMFLIGKAYCCGFGGLLDTRQALDWLCRAARKGHAEAQLEVSKIHSADYGLETLGVPPDHGLALMWFELATSTGRLFDDPYKKRLMRKVPPAEISRARELMKNWKDGKCDV